MHVSPGPGLRCPGSGPAPVPAPVYVAPVCAPAPVCCAPAPTCGCCGGGHVGFFAKWKAKHSHSCSGCSGVTYAPVYTSTYVAAPCSYGTTTVMPPAVKTKEMPKP